MPERTQLATGMSATDRAGIEVVLVDDESHLAEMTAAYLVEGYEKLSVTAYMDVREALDHVATEVVDCILSDYDMPDMDGLEFLDRVRSGHPELPFVLYTGRGSEEVARCEPARQTWTRRTWPPQPHWETYSQVAAGYDSRMGSRRYPSGVPCELCVTRLTW
jgi:CheY-like chemotaxis protein